MTIGRQDGEPASLLRSAVKEEDAKKAHAKKVEIQNTEVAAPLPGGRESMTRGFMRTAFQQMSESKNKVESKPVKPAASGSGSSLKIPE